MKNIKRIVLLGIIYLAILGGLSNVKAATASISSNKKSMTVGETATITVSIEGAAWNLHASGATSLNEVGYTDNGENTKKTFTMSFKPTKAGTYQTTLTGDVSDGTTNATTNVSGSVKIEVKDKAATNNTNNTNTTNNNTTTPKVSNDATLKNLGITPKQYDFSGFKKNTTSYSVSVANEAEKISIYATPTNSKAK